MAALLHSFIGPKAPNTTGLSPPKQQLLRIWTKSLLQVSLGTDHFTRWECNNKTRTVPCCQYSTHYICCFSCSLNTLGLKNWYQTFIMLNCQHYCPLPWESRNSETNHFSFQPTRLPV